MQSQVQAQELVPRTAVMAIKPRFLLVNKLDEAVQFHGVQMKEPPARVAGTPLTLTLAQPQPQPSPNPNPNPDPSPNPNPNPNPNPKLNLHLGRNYRPSHPCLPCHEPYA